jgi:3-hydroxyacyl-CoA dehydrogenase/enoyl-CoA hydratase/3-hydroxybutyryl-CoA epimerase
MEAIVSDAQVTLGLDRASGIATLTLDGARGVNALNAEFISALEAAVTALKGLQGLAGVLVESAHGSTTLAAGGPWCVGADLDQLWTVREAEALRRIVSQLHRALRALETCGAPVVALLDGAALGGGCELALACHRRVAVERRDVRIGLPEVGLGVIPGAGGTQRLPRLVGLQKALDVILAGKVLGAREALELGLVDELAPDAPASRRQALEWLATRPEPAQRWDRPGYAFPAPAPGTSEARDLLMGAAAQVIKRTAGAFLAPQAALNAVAEGARLSLEAGLAVETAWFVEQFLSPQARDMLRTLWFHKRAADRLEGLPRAAEPGVRRVGILGAGMMGAGLASLAAQRGFQVVLKDVSQVALDRALEQARAAADARAARGGEAAEAVLARVNGTLAAADLAGVDLVIEAVFEDPELKQRVTREAQPFVAPGGLWASNTSALPMALLSQGYPAPERFLGLHFFSPVEAMPLVEVVRGPATSEEALGRALAFVRALGKTPMLVNDGWGFFTTRVFARYILEGACLVADGHDPAVVEWAARAAGMVVGPLQVFDEISLTLGEHVVDQRLQYLGTPADESGVALLRRMIHQLDRKGRAAGAGFYQYQDGRRRGLWPGLADLAGSPGAGLAGKVRDPGAAAERLLYAQAAEAVRALQEGVLRQPRDADLGAVLGIGFGAMLGGPLAWLDRRGAGPAVADLERLAALHGARFAPPELLSRMAREGARFYPD